MSKFLKGLKDVVSTLLVLAIFVGIGFSAGWFYRGEKDAEGTTVTYSGGGHKLPGETQKMTITRVEVISQLNEIGELATIAGEYRVTMDTNECRDTYGMNLPLTANYIKLTCTGYVKVGYEVNQVDVVVDNNEQKIYVKLPAPQVFDNYLVWDTVECEEKNNIRNPIDFEQYRAMFEYIEKVGLEDVEADNIYDKAEENMQWITRKFLSVFEDYSVEFT